MKSKSKQDWAYDAAQHTAFHIADTFVGEKIRHFFRVRKYNFPSLNRVCWIEVRASIAQMVCYLKSEMDRRQTRKMFLFSMQTEIRRDFQIQTEIHKKIKKREKKQEKIDGKFSKQKHTNIVFLSKSTENNNRANETIIKWEKLDCEKSVKFPRIQ